MTTSGERRSFLFLQGLATPFFSCLGRQIRLAGHDVHKIHICGGDLLFWWTRGGVSYRGSLSDWPEFLRGFMQRNGITDLVVFGDCRPYHRAAISLARDTDVAVHVFEEGYFRPHWLTLEKGGTNRYSPLPRTPDEIVSQDTRVDVPAHRCSGGFSKRICWELASQAATMLLAPLYPKYQRHRPYHPMKECAGWLWRFAKRPMESRYASKVMQFLGRETPEFYLLPLQLESDYQIREHSDFKSLEHLFKVVLNSFANHAPAESLLVIKLHPLDNGLHGYRRRLARIAENLGLQGRIILVDGGHLPTFLSMCRGVVLVNSTAGLSALHHDRPVKALGHAIFDVPGLVFQGSLDEFWRDPQAPDRELLCSFRRVVLDRSQVNGSFFTRTGMSLGVDGVLDRLGVIRERKLSAGFFPAVGNAVFPSDLLDPPARSILKTSISSGFKSDRIH